MERPPQPEPPTRRSTDTEVDADVHVNADVHNEHGARSALTVIGAALEALVAGDAGEVTPLQRSVLSGVGPAVDQLHGCLSIPARGADARAACPEAPSTSGGQRAQRTAPAPEAARPPSHVLVVDDEPSITALVALKLEVAGFRVTIAEDGHAGVLAAQAHRPDVVLMDWRMPRMDGLEATRALRSSHEHGVSRTPTIMMTTMADSRDVVRGLEAGADDYLIKPFSPDELLWRIEAVLADEGERPDHAPSVR